MSDSHTRPVPSQGNLASGGRGEPPLFSCRRRHPQPTPARPDLGDARAHRHEQCSAGAARPPSAMPSVVIVLDVIVVLVVMWRGLACEIRRDPVRGIVLDTATGDADIGWLQRPRTDDAFVPLR